MDEHHLYHPTYIKLLCLYSTEGCVQGRGDYTNSPELQFFRKKKSCREPLHSCVDYAMLLNCTQVLRWSLLCCFVVFNQNKQQNPFLFSSSLFSVSRLYSLFRVLQPSATHLPGGRDPGWPGYWLSQGDAQRLLGKEYCPRLRTYWAGAGTSGYREHTERPQSLWFPLPGAWSQHEHHGPFSSLSFILKQRCQ